MADYRDMAAALSGGYGQDTGPITADTLITLKNGKKATAGDLLGMLKGFSQAVGSNLESLSRGGVASVIGAGGDIESFARTGINKLYGAGGVNVSPTPVLPTSTDILGMIPRGTTTRPETAGMEELGGYMTPATAKVLKPAVMATGRLAGQEIANVSSGMPSRSLLGDITPKPKQIFIGENAQTWNKAAADQAVQMEKAGARPTDIWAATGTFRGPEGKLRQEISDVPSYLNEQKIPEPPSVLNVATQYLRDKGVITSPTRDIASRDVPEHLRDEAINYAKWQLQKMDQPKTLLGNAFEHPELFQAYPEAANVNLAKETSGMYRGTYQPDKNLVTTGGGTIGPSESHSTLLHELQHYVQQQEGMAKGGNPEIVPQIIRQQWPKEAEPYWKANAQYNRASGQMAYARNVQYMQKLDNLAVADNIKPTQITNLADWYEHSHTIRSELGKMPQRKSFERDEWLRRSAQILKREILKKEPGLYDYAEQMTPNEAKNLYRKSDRAMDKVRADAVKYGEVNRKFKELEQMEPTEAYMHLAGEAEARATQQRMGMTMKERRAKFPFESYDRPTNRLLVYGQK
jgi:hypothetical protein